MTTPTANTHQIECLNPTCGYSGRVVDGCFLSSAPPTFCPLCESFAIRRDGVTLCPSCAGAGAPAADAHVLCCSVCACVFTDAPITPAVAWRYVHWYSMDEGARGETFLFDIIVDTRRGPERSHGLASKRTKKVVQYG